MGFAAAAPFLFKSLSCPIGGITADLLRRRILSTKTVRRVYYSTGTVHCALQHLYSLYWPHSKRQELAIGVRLREVSRCEFVSCLDLPRPEVWVRHLDPVSRRKRVLLNGVNRQPSSGLKFNRQSSKKVIFYRQPSKMQINISILRYFKCLFFS